MGCTCSGALKHVATLCITAMTIKVQGASWLLRDISFLLAVGRHSPSEVNGKRPHWQEPASGRRAVLPIKNMAWNVLLALTKFGVLGGSVYLLFQDLNVFVKEYIYGESPCLDAK